MKDQKIENILSVGTRYKYVPHISTYITKNNIFAEDAKGCKRLFSTAVRVTQTDAFAPL